MTPQSVSFVPRSRARRTALAAVVAVAAAGATAGTAGAAGAQRTKGHVKAGGIDVTFSATRAAGAPATSATGTFVAEGAPAAIMGVPSEVGSIRLSGPITCLETHGEDVSFFYPFDQASTSGVLDKLGAGMIVSLHKGSSDKYNMGFVPMLTSMVPVVGCDSSVTPLAVTSGGWQNGG